MTDDLPKVDTVEFTSYSTANIGFIQVVLGVRNLMQRLLRSSAWIFRKYQEQI